MDGWVIWRPVVMPIGLTREAHAAFRPALPGFVEPVGIARLARVLS
jgi:hypothetical protein